MNSRLALITFFCFLLTITAGNTQQTFASGADQYQLNLLRDYMASHRIFNRLDYLSDEASFKQANIPEKIQQGQKAVSRILWSVQREYPMYSMGQRIMVYSIPFTLMLWNRVDLWQKYLNFSRDLKIITAMFTTVPALLLINPIHTIGSQLYYTALPPSIPEANLIHTYGSKKNLLDKATQHYIEDELFYTLWQSPSSEANIRLHKILDKALRLPFYTKPLIYDKEKIDSALNHFAPELVNRLNRFALAEIMFQKMDTHPQGHYPVYFQGVPGTGKSYGAKKLAKAMGTNLAVVTLDGATIDDMTGTPFESFDGKAGRLVDAIIANTTSSRDINHKNQILFIDEFDRLLLKDDKQSEEVLGFLLKLLDPAHRSFYNPYLKTNIRLPDTIILAGNSDIHELSKKFPQLEAMASRLDKVVFEGFPMETKKLIAFNLLIPQLEDSYRSTDQELANFSLSNSDQAKIAAFITTDNDPGLRSLEKFINEVFELNLQLLSEAGMLTE